MLVTGTYTNDTYIRAQPFVNDQEGMATDPIARAKHFPLDNFVRANINAGLQPSTIATYRRDVVQFFAWLGESPRDCFQITTNDLLEYIEYLKHFDCNSDQGAKSRYSPSTLRRKMSSIRRFYQVMVSIGVIVKNPAQDLRISILIPINPRKPPIPLTVEQTGGLLSWPDLTNPKGYRDRAMLALMVLAGLASFEVHLLNTADFSRSDGRLQVIWRANKKRELYLPEFSTEILTSWLNVRQLLDPQSSAMFISLHWSRGEGNQRSRISTRSIYKVVRCGLTSIGIKSDGNCTRLLRATFAALLLESGATEADLRMVLGIRHKSYTVLDGISSKI